MPKNNHCKDCASENCFLFKNSHPDFHEELMSKKSCVSYKKKQLVFQEGEPVSGVYFIREGKVKVSKEADYRGQIVRLAKSGDVLGHRGINKKNIYPITASAIEDSLICFVEQEMLFKLMNKNSELSIKMMLFYADELQKTEIRLRNMAIMTVRERIADALLMIHDVFGVKKGKEFLLDVELSRKDIAEIAGTYQEQASRFITEFKSEGILALDGKKIIIQQFDKLVEEVKKYEA